MATYSRYRRAWRSGSYRTRGSYGRRWYGGKNKKYWGQFKAANQQRDQATMVLNSQYPIDLRVAVGESETLAVTNVWEILRNSPFFGNYSGMYDQVKMDSVRIKLTGSWMQQSTADQTKRLIPTITTAFDRNGFMDADTPRASDVTSYSSCISKPWSLGSAFSQTRSIYTTTMQEKSQYIPTSSLADPTDADHRNCNNPCYNRSCISCPFKPIYIVHGFVPSPAQDTDTVLHLVAEFDICVTFRGLRKRPSAYEGIDTYLLETISFNGLEYTAFDDEIYKPTGQPELFSEAGTVIFFSTVIGGDEIRVMTRRVSAGASINFFEEATGDNMFYFFKEGTSRHSATLRFKLKGGNNIVTVGFAGSSFDTDDWATSYYPTLLLGYDADWYTANDATPSPENMN